jgi:hypothetical protein
MIRERLSAGKARAKQLGRHVHGRVPYGYRSDRGRLEPDPDTAPIVQRIFQELRDGSNPSRIARELNRSGIPAPQGTEWRRSGVIVILRNVAYTGERYGVKRAHPAIPARVQRGAGEPRSRSPPPSDKARERAIKATCAWEPGLAAVERTQELR